MVFCSCCYFSLIPPVTIRLFATSAALLYGQRLLCANRGKWTRRITLLVSVLVSVILSALGIFLLVLATNDDYRRSNFVSLCTSQALRSTPLDEHRCSILNEGVVHGHVLEIGPGPGTNFRCFHNDTSIDEYVAVEPNSFFEIEMRKELDRRGLNFLLRFVGIKGEEVDVPNESFDVVILTHVLCSVDSVANVLNTAERALKPGGKIIFMEHVTAAKENTLTSYLQSVVAPILFIVANGCAFKNLGDEIAASLGNRFDTAVQNFDAPMPLGLAFARPHIKGIAIKK